MDSKKIAISINLDWPLKRYHDLYAGIQDYNKKYTNWTLVWDHYPENVLTESKTEAYYDGIIGRIKYTAHEQAIRLNIPMVNTWYSSDIEDIPSVFIDHFQAGVAAAEHLLKRGFRNFVNIDHRNDKTAKAFLEGFQSAVKPYKTPIKRYLVNRNLEASSQQWFKFHKDFSDWVEDWEFPVGICCSMDSLGPKISTRCLEHGLRIPEDVALVTSGNDLTYCESHRPHISSVDMNYHKVGYEAARMLDKQLQGKSLEKKHMFIQPMGFVARESTDSYAVEDEIVKKAIRFIADNVHHNIQVADIVDHVPISRRSLELRFKDAIGHSMIDEINRLRITTLKRLLIESDMKINKLYFHAGFSSPLHMRRVFSKYTGMSPSQFRQSISE